MAGFNHIYSFELELAMYGYDIADVGFKPEDSRWYLDDVEESFATPADLLAYLKKHA